MVDRLRIEIEGAEELSRNLSILGEEATKVGRSALRAAAKELAKNVSMAAPANPSGPTKKSWRRKDGSVVSAFYGSLKENINVVEDRARADNTIIMKVTTGNAFWGLFQEFGWRLRNGERKRGSPWFRPVFEAESAGIVSQLVTTLDKKIIAAAKRMERRRRR